MNMPLLRWFCLASLMLACGSIHAAEVTGQVRLYSEGRWGEGVVGVLISNGRDITRTDADGRYRIPVESGQTVFVIKPSDYRHVVDADGLARHWRHHLPEGSPTLRHGGIPATGTSTSQWNFGLVPRETSPDRLNVLVFGDPQTGTSQEVGYFAHDIIAPLLTRGDDAPPGSAQAVFDGQAAQLGITLGDIVNDDLALYPAIRAEHDKLGVPWLYVPGNHDLDFDADSDDTSLLTYRQHFGPDTFAWEEPQASFIVLDNVIYRPGQTPRYLGGLREVQLEFLRQYLATLPAGRKLVVAAHMPFHDSVAGQHDFRPEDRHRLFALLARFPQPLLLTAHTHNQRHYRHRQADGWRGETPLHEYNVGTTNGGYWAGLKDADGIPDAMMSDGTPNGFARLSLPGGAEHVLSWEVARNPDHPGITLHAPRVLRHGAYPGVHLYANVFMGEVDTRVEYRIDNGDWLPMTRSVQTDPRVVAVNLADDAASALRAFDRTPEATPSWHVWRTALSTRLAPGDHDIEVRAFDRWRGELRASTRYRLIEQSP